MISQASGECPAEQGGRQRVDRVQLLACRHADRLYVGHLLIEESRDALLFRERRKRKHELFELFSCYGIK